MAAYKAKSLTGAQRRVRELQQQIVALNNLLNQWNRDRIALAKLAATGPAFFNPLEAIAAEQIRDAILAKLKMNPDGTFK